MNSNYYLEAKRLDEEEGDYIKAIEVCNEGIKAGDYKCSYLKGIILLLNLGDKGVKEAIDAFEIGRQHGDYECSYELAKIYSGKEYKGFENYKFAVELYLDLGLYKGEDINFIINMIKRHLGDILYKKSASTLEFVNECIKLSKKTNNTKILNVIYKCLESYINAEYNDIIANCNTIEILDSIFMSKTRTNCQLSDIALDKYRTKRACLFINGNPTIAECEKYKQENLYSGIIYCNAIKILDSYIGKSYLMGINGAIIDYDLAKKYYMSAAYYIYNEYDALLSKEINRLINCNKIDIVKDIIPLLYDTSLKREYYFKLFPKKLIIFDLDGTIFDTDCIRIERNNGKHFTEDDLENIKYIKGFENLFLKETSYFSLSQYDVLIVTSNRKIYSERLICNHQELQQHITSVFYAASQKKELIRRFLEEHNEYSEVYAFGDDEKDANIYAELNLKFYIVKNNIGYPNDYRVVLNELNDEKNKFRNNYLYDLKRIRDNQNCVGFVSKYMDDIVVYYKYYNVTNNHSDPFYTSGSDYSPSDGNRVPVKILNNYELGKTKKRTTICSTMKDEFVKSLSDLQIDNNTILTRIPGHNELIYDCNEPMSIIIKEVIKEHGCGIDGSAILHRCDAVEESKTGNRSIYKHLNSIEVIENNISIYGKTIYLLDDIVTSGASLIACTELLYRHGAGHVICVCLARTCGSGKYAPVYIR